ncbi:MAG TPA: hypothetical protein PK245_06310, partial [Clostridia bacterium]|nr:hypothetical protein [Clostridia bacterium]
MVKKRNVLLIKSEKTHKGAAAVLAGAFKNHPDLRFISIGEDKLGFKSVNTLRVLCLRALKRSPLLMRGAARLQKVFADRSINDTPSGDKDKKQLPGKEKKLKNAVLRFEPAAIVAMTPFDMRLVLRTRKKAGLKTPVVGILNTFTLDFGFFDMSADAYLALDEAAKEKMVGLGYPEDKVTVAGYPVDAKALSEEEIAEIRAGLSVPKTP